MEMYTFDDLKTKKLVREVGDYMDEIALTYLDLMIELSDRYYPDGATEEEWTKFCEDMSNILATSLEKACDMRGL